MKRILLATDGSPDAVAAAAVAAGLAKAYGAEVIVAFVETPTGWTAGREPMAIPPDVIQTIRERAVNPASDVLDAEGVPFVAVALAGDPAMELVRAADEQRVDAIVIGHRGHSRLDRFFAGSVTDKVVHHAPCPVVVVPESLDVAAATAAASPDGAALGEADHV